MLNVVDSHKDNQQLCRDSELPWPGPHTTSQRLGQARAEGGLGEAEPRGHRGRRDQARARGGDHVVRADTGQMFYCTGFSRIMV